MNEPPPVIYQRKLIFAADHAAAMVNRVELNTPTEAHGHDFMEIALAAAGEGAHQSTSGEQNLKPGDTLVLRPGAWHRYTRCKGLVIYNCCFDSALLRRELGWLREDPALNYMLWAGPLAGERRGLLIFSLDPPGLAECLEHLERLEQVQSSPRRAETLARLLLFLDCLARGGPGLVVPAARPLHPAVLAAARDLESDLAHTWSLAELAERVHLAPSYLVRLFKSETGLAPMAYLQRCRLERAAGLLLRTRDPVAEVAAEVGWFDQNLFARRFKAAYGLSASEYRRRFGAK